MLLEHAFWGWMVLFLVGLLPAAWGFLCLLWLIPRLSKEANVRTDVFLARASFWSIIVGLAGIGGWLLAALVVHSLAVLKVVQVLK